MKQKIVIIGAGGHGKVICDAILAQDKYELVGFVDALIPVGEIVFKEYKVIESQKNVHLLKDKADVFIVAIGNNTVREKIYHLVNKTLEPGIVIHPSAIIGSEVSIKLGTVILANSVINASCEIGINTIINVALVIDHDCKIGDHIHLSIGTMVGSNSIVSDFYTSSIGENIPSFSKII